LADPLLETAEAACQLSNMLGRDGGRSLRCGSFRPGDENLFPRLGSPLPFVQFVDLLPVLLLYLHESIEPSQRSQQLAEPCHFVTRLSQRDRRYNRMG
jgi:hypothetical protein